MAILDIITKEDLQQFKKELVEELKLFKANNSDEKSFLRSSDVRKLLKISPGTLQNLRVNGILPYQKIGGRVYYGHNDIKKLSGNIGGDFGNSIHLFSRIVASFFGLYCSFYFAPKWPLGSI